MSTLLKKGAGLVVNVDPMVSFTSTQSGGVMGRGGYFTLIQAVKGLIQSRAKTLLKHSMDKNPDVDFINFCPTDSVMEIMAGNPMKYRMKNEIAELAFECTRTQILQSYEALSHKFMKHGFKLKAAEEIEKMKYK